MQKFFPFILTILLFSASVRAQSNKNFNNQIAQEIENILIFSDKEKTKIEIINAKNRKKDEFSINHTKQGKKADGSKNLFKISKPHSRINIDVKKHEKLAYSAYLEGQYEIAIELYKQILQKEPQNDYAKYSLAMLYQKLHQYSEAKILYRELLKNDSQNREEIISNLLMIVSEESPHEALYMLSRLSMQHPESDYLLAQSALVYEKNNNYKQAISNLRKAIKIAPWRVDYQYNIAIIYDKNKEYEKAIEAYYSVMKNFTSDEKWSNIISLNQVNSRVLQLKDLI